MDASAMTVTLPVQRLGDDYKTAESLDVWAVVQRVQAGDKAAYGIIWSRYHQNVYRFVHRRVQNHAIAEDLTSIVFERGLRNIARFTWQGRDFGAWLITIARNLSLDHHTSGFYRFECAAFDFVMESDRPDQTPATVDVLAAADQYQTLLEAMRQLTAEQREVLTLRCLRELSVRETAEALGKEEGAVKALSYRAAVAMRRILGPGFHPVTPLRRSSR